MKHFKQSELTFLRAALMFALMVLTTASAWAEKISVSFQTLVGNEWKTRQVDATVLTGNEKTLPWGYYVVNSNITFNHGVQFSGNVYIILADGCTMTMGSPQERLGTYGLYGSAGTISDNYGTDYELYIYGQSQQSGRLEIYSSTTKSNVSGIKVKSLYMYGGNIDLNGYNGINTRGIWDGYVIINNGNVSFTSTKNYGKGIDSHYFRMSGGTFYAYGLANHAIYSHDFAMSGGWLSVIDAGGIYCYSTNNDNNNGTFLMTGGNLSVNGKEKGIYAPTITLGLTKEGDQIKANNYYESTVTVQTGKKLMDNNDHAALYYGTLTDEQKNAIKGKTLVPAKFDGTGTEQDPYVIHTAKGWDAFCAMFGTSAAPYDFNDVYVKLGNDISVTTMAGISGHPFKGHFDGGGHTLTVNYSVDNENYIAPFRFVDGATFEDLNIEGTIYASAMKAGGLIGDGAFTKTTITNCRVSATITGGNETGGFISNGKVEIDHCVFNGKFINSYHHGGFIGHNNSDESSISNSLFDPQSESNYRHTFYSSGNNPTIGNCYYTTNAVADNQANLAHLITADPGADMTLKENSPNGVQFGTTCYAADEETVYLTLKAPGTPPDGYTKNDGNYWAGSQTLPFNGTYYTLVMGNKDVRITAFTLATYYITFNPNDGTLPEGLSYPTSYNILSDDVLLPAPTKDGNSFMGWYNNEGLTGNPVSCIPAGSTGDKAFYAKWEATRTKKSLLDCTAVVPNQTKSATSTTEYGERNYSYIYSKFEEANYPSYGVSVGETVTDVTTNPATTLTLGTDYKFGNVYYSDMTGMNEPEHVGDNCLVEIIGMGDYDGTLYAPFIIIGPSVSNQTWGDLTWSLSNGELSISLTNPANGNKPMPETTREGYPWYPFGSYITSITIDEGITTIAASAFASTSNVSTYGNVTSVSLPSTLTSIGDYAFDHCTGATITIPTNTTTFGSAPFNQVGHEDNGVIKGGVTATLSDTGDNSALIGALSSAKYANVTINRTLYKDGAWNTLCLPFDMTNAQLTDQLAPYALKEVDVDNYYDANNIPYEKRDDGKYYNGSTEYTGTDPLHQTGLDGTTLNLYFKDATSIEAGKPYIIKWNKPNDYVAYNGQNADACSDITSLTFNGVKIDADASTEVSFTGGKFKSTYAPKTFENEDKSVLLLGVGKNNQNQDVSTLYYPKPSGGKNPGINAFRAYFQIGDGTSAPQLTAFNLNFDDGETTGIKSLSPDLSPSREGSAGAWYSLDGRKLSGKPTHKGLYINGGRKVVIK